MKKLLIWTMTALFASIAIATASPTATALETKEKAAWQAFKDKKPADFEKLLSPDVVVVYDSGIQGLSRELSDMSKMEMKSFELSDFKITMSDADTAIVAYVCKMKAGMDGQDASGTYNCASVWQMKNGEWRAVFHTDVKATDGQKKE